MGVCHGCLVYASDVQSNVLEKVSPGRLALFETEKAFSGA